MYICHKKIIIRLYEERQLFQQSIPSVLRRLQADDNRTDALGHHTDKALYNLRGVETVLLSKLPEAARQWQRG